MDNRNVYFDISIGGIQSGRITFKVKHKRKLFFRRADCAEVGTYSMVVVFYVHDIWVCSHTLMFMVVVVSTLPFL